MTETKPTTSATKTTTAPKRSKLRWALRQTRRLIVLLSVGLLLFGVGFAIYAWEINYRGDRAVREIRRELSDRGILDLYWRDTDTDEEDWYTNATSAKYWRAAMQAVPEPGDRPLLSVGLIAVNDIEDRQQYHPDTIAALREVFVTYPHFLPLIESARKAPPGRFDLNGDLSDPMKGLSLLGETHRVARWLQERSCLAEIDQDSEAYTHAITSILLLSEHLNQEGDILSALVSGSIDALARYALMSGLSRIELTPEHLDQLANAFEARRASTDILSCIGMDLSWQYHLVTMDVQSYLRLNEAKKLLMSRQFMREHPDWFEDVELPSRAERFWPNILLTVCPGRYELRHAALMRESLAYFDQLESLKNKPRERWAWLTATYRQIQAIEDNKEETDFDNMQGNNVVITARSMTRMESRMSIVPVALRIEKYRIENGRWPNTIEDAVGETPLDAYGQPIRYRKTTQGVMIYTTGDNTIDEQGYNDQEYERSPQFPDADDFPAVLYNPELRNVLPPPEQAIDPEEDYDW